MKSLLKLTLFYFRLKIKEPRYFYLIVIAVSIASVMAIVHVLYFLIYYLFKNIIEIPVYILRNKFLISLFSEDSIQAYYLYFLEISVLALFLASFWLTKRSFYALFSFLYLFIFVDDFFQVHEAFGAYFSAQVTFDFFQHIGGHNVGEIIGWCIMAILFACLI